MMLRFDWQKAYAGNNSVALILIPANVQRFFQDQSHVSVNAANLLEALQALDGMVPGFARNILREKSLRGFVRIYVDGAAIQETALEKVTLEPRSKVQILMGLAGG